jgi:mannitol-1-phosphate 5-dehydrogenase
MGVRANYQCIVRTVLSPERPMKLVHFGAGRIGRSFIGQLFSKAGWDVMFVDVDRGVVNELNRRGQYRVVVKDEEGSVILVQNVNAIHTDDEEQVVAAVSGADLLSTAVGKHALAAVTKPIARGIADRHKRNPKHPIDIILCENMKGAAGFFKEKVKEHLPAGFPVDSYVGFVETSIGKMVPLMSEEERKKDPLLVYAESYNTLIVDKHGFRGTVPDVPGIEPKAHMKAWVDRKLFIHNLGHAVLSYVSYAFFPEYRYMWQAVSHPALHRITKAAMWESGRALIAEYPGEFDTSSIGVHIEDLLRRFGNRALADTVYRVGMDLYRKLFFDDRLIGAVTLCLKHRIRPVYISLGIAAAMCFRAVGENGRMFERDKTFMEQEMTRGVDHTLTHVCRLEDEETRRLIKKYFDIISKMEYPVMYLDVDRLVRG